MKKILEHLIRLVAKYLFAVGVVFTLQYLFFLLMPMSFWVEYVSVEPLKKENIIGEYFYMVTERHVKRDIDMARNDIMYCSTDDGSFRFSSYISSGRAKKHDHKKIAWRYEGYVPAIPRECYMLSNITTIHQFWIVKTKQIVSGPFSFN